MTDNLSIAQFMSRMANKVAIAETERLCDMLSIEETLWQQGFCRIAGVDEAGRGPLAGPIVAAAVVLNSPLDRLNDSKRLSDLQRRRLFDEITQKHLVGISLVSAAEIDTSGIQQANYKAMRDAIMALKHPPDFALIDGYSLSGISQPLMRVIKGDARSLSIAAASVVAKVTRDNVLLAMDAEYPGYGFADHKGYGTRAHMEAIHRFGPCPEHRRSFAPLCHAHDMEELF